MLTTRLKDFIISDIVRKSGQQQLWITDKRLSGGSINDAFKVTCSQGNYFLKINSAGRFPGMFEAEKRGLELLRSTNAVRIPEVIINGHCDDTLYLVLEYMEAAKRKKDYWEQLGTSVANLHRHTSATFGLDHDNYIGSLRQSNKSGATGIEFMITQRFEPLVKMAVHKTHLTKVQTDAFEKLYTRLPEIIPDEPPTLLHGDLWNGNVITGPDGHAWLIDPAVYYGHREMDLAMTKLFGGFDADFYRAYEEAFPLHPGFEDRVEIHNLYPLMVHVNLFGGGYLAQVKAILKRVCD
jgi:fructosamine-3-kinase